MEPNDENSYLIKKEEYQFMNNLEENLKGISLRQKNRSKKARELYKAMGDPTLDDLKVMIQINLIKNNKVTVDGVNLSTKVYDPDVGEIKEKTTRMRPTSVLSNIVEITE